MEDEDQIAASHEPIKTPEEWFRVRRAAERSDKMWVLIGPFHAVLIEHRRALYLVGAIVVILAREKVVGLLDLIQGLGQ